MKALLRAVAALMSMQLLATSGVTAQHEDEHGHDHEETHIELSPSTLAENSVQFDVAASGTIEERLRLNGRLVGNENKIAHVVSRFPGVIKETRRQVGDYVKAGETLVAVESNQNLQSLELKAPLSGTVVKRHATVGELATESEELFVIADFSELWADLFLFSPDFGKVRVGQAVKLFFPDRPRPVESTISLVSSVVDERTQSKFVRSVVSNREGNLYPGQFLKGEVVLESTHVPVAIRASAIQRIDQAPTVFVEHDGKLEPRKVTLGKNDGTFVEVQSGLSKGERYAYGNTFILKAEAGKGEAEHDH